MKKPLDSRTAIVIVAMAATGLTLGLRFGGFFDPGRQAAKGSSAEVISRLKVDPLKIEADARRLAKQAAGEHRRVLVYFHADWCGPCEEIGHAFERTANKPLFDGWYLASVDVDQMPTGQALGLEVEFIPLFAKLDEQGKVVGTLGGEGFGAAPTPEHVDQVLRTFLGS